MNTQIVDLQFHVPILKITSKNNDTKSVDINAVKIWKKIGNF